MMPAMAQNKWWVLAAVCIATFMLLLDLRLFRNRSFDGVSIGAFGL